MRPRHTEPVVIESGQVNSDGKSKTQHVPPIRAQAPHRVRLPGFITDENIGLGDAIKRATSSVGMYPCGGCARQAAALNRWMQRATSMLTNGRN